MISKNEKITQLIYFVFLLIVCSSIILSIACQGSGSDNGGGGDTSSNKSAKSTSFMPITALDNNNQAVPIHWVYKINNGQPVKAIYNGMNMDFKISLFEVSINPGDLKRHVIMRGQVTGGYQSQTFKGDYSATADENYKIDNGKTYLNNQLLNITLSISEGSESISIQISLNTKSFIPPYEWFLDRETLDQLDIGYTTIFSSISPTDFKIAITGYPDITKTDIPTNTSDTWEIMEKFSSMTVQGKLYNNIVKISRQTILPDMNGNMTPVTMYYWVAKGIGIIKGQGLYRILNVDDMVIELTDTNLIQ